ncbi:hypothetical protein LshimejAT787_0209930 [Lyophyllum shimeji]|uniref:Postreplication repair E3 ubiquitin-protein ligase RAD18 n=1 Tax=Lyophyllum shimeji TaxID=47721 RepID=A0A9P3PGC0_LYOSH|nr:hypothetical protein LshimejAT787_0209930 [Lyophyllum shimeji]
MNSFLTTHVPDPTDFPPLNIAPGLRTLDGSLRCNICGELYDAPVTLNCGHCFCSFCVRASLAEKQECPSCRKTAIEGHLRPNPVVEEVVSAWKLSRPYILNLAKEDERQRDATQLMTPKAKKRKITPDNEARSEASTSGGFASPSKSKRIRQSYAELSGATIPTSDVDEDEMPELPNANQDPRPDDLVQCPLCTKRVKYKRINQHMDKGCKDTPPDSTTSGWNKLMAKPSKGKKNASRDTSDDEDNIRLPKASYATLKDKKLKEMLVEQGLSTTGDRNQWIQRHQRWVMIYNANLDRSSKHRKTKQELRKELKKWEDEKVRKKKTTVEDTAAHEKRHKGEFAQLIDAARPGGDKGRAMESKTKRPLLAERSNGDIAIPPGSDKLQEISPAEPRRPERDEDVIVVDSEEELEMDQLLKDKRSSLTSYPGLPRADAKLIKSKGIPSVRRIVAWTEPLFPSPAWGGKFGKSILHKEVLNEDMNVRVLLLPPRSPSDESPYGKSVIDLFTRFGSVSAEIIRLPGAEKHFFQLYVTSCEQNAIILLPTDFRGTIDVEGCSRVRYDGELRRRIDQEVIRINATDTRRDGDEVYIHATGGVEIRVVNETREAPKGAVWYGYSEHDTGTAAEMECSGGGASS